MRLRDKALTWQAVGDDVIVLDLDGSMYLRINGSGSVLWEALADGASEAELTDMLLEEFDVTTEQASADVGAFVADLRSRGLIEE